MSGEMKQTLSERWRLMGEQDGLLHLIGRRGVRKRWWLTACEDQKRPLREQPNSWAGSSRPEKMLTCPLCREIAMRDGEQVSMSVTLTRPIDGEGYRVAADLLEQHHLTEQAETLRKIADFMGAGK